MKRLLSLLMTTIMTLGLYAQSSQSATSTLSYVVNTGYTWTDGNVFLRYMTKDIDELMGVVNDPSKNVAVLVGGTVHEGGLSLKLKLTGNKLIASGGEESMNGTVELTQTQDALLIRDAQTGELKDVLVKMKDPNMGAYELLTSDMTRFGMAGTYQDQNGLEYVFLSHAQEVHGHGPINGQFKYMEAYDFPTYTLKFGNTYFSVERTGYFLILVEVKTTDDEETFTTKPGGRRYILKQIFNRPSDFYGLTSTAILTSAQLLGYAGDGQTGHEQGNYAEECKVVAEQLAVVRNAIFARHGYIFTSERWKDAFDEMPWYNGLYTDVNSKLSYIEKINIEHLRYLEKLMKQRATEE